MKTKLWYPLILSCALFAQLASAEKLKECTAGDLPEVYPCALESEEGDQLLHTMLLQHHNAASLVKSGPTTQPSFDQYRVALLASAKRVGHGPGTSRFHAVYKIQVLIQSMKHGPADGTEPSLLNVVVHEKSSSRGVNYQFESNLKKVKDGYPQLVDLPLLDGTEGVAEKMSSGFEP